MCVMSSFSKEQMDWWQPNAPDAVKQMVSQLFSRVFFKKGFGRWKLSNSDLCFGKWILPLVVAKNNSQKLS